MYMIWRSTVFSDAQRGRVFYDQQAPLYGRLFLREQRVIGIIDQTGIVAKLAPPFGQAWEAG